MNDNNIDDDYDIHELRFRESELTSNHTRYDNTVAGGSDQTRFVQWVVYSTISLSVAAFVLLVLLGVLSNQRVRSRPFNLYLVFLMVPDLVFSLFCGINCALNAAKGDYVSAAWCRFQVVYAVWGIGSNAWLNAAIARHVHDMLSSSRQMKRYCAPTQKRVILEALSVYAWLGFVSAWPFLGFLPHRLGLSAGLACLPHEYDVASTVFLWCVFMPCFALIPTAYALWVAFDVWHRGLLPPSGKKRNIAVYFFRLTVVFLVMWVPSIFLMFIAGGFLTSWVAFLGGCWSHLQGAVSGVASIMKQDIGQAFVEFLACGRLGLLGDQTEEAGSSQLVGFRSFRFSSVGKGGNNNGNHNSSVVSHPPLHSVESDDGCASDDGCVEEGRASNNNTPITLPEEAVGVVETEADAA